MIHMESSSEGFTHVGEDNDDPDGKCTNDNVSLTTVRLDDVHSLKDMCTCLHPNSECLPEYSVDTPVHSQHQINGHATKALSAHKTVSSKTVRSTGQLSSAMTTGYISTGYISDSNSSHLPHFRSGFTLSVSTDGYVGDINLQPELQEAPVVAFSEDNIEPSFINSNDDCVFDSSSSMRCGLPFHHSPGILPIADIKGEVIGVEEGSQQAHTLSLSASEYVRNFHSHQLHCSAPISTSSDDRDGFSISPMSSGGYICGYPCIARHDDNEVRGLDSAQSQPSAPLTFLFHDKNSSDYSCNSNLPTSAIRELVPTRKQPSVSLSASVVDGYIHDSSCIPPSPTDAVHEHSQPSMLPSALDNDGSIGESSLSHQLHPSSPIRTPSGDHDCAPISLTASDGYVCEFPCNSPLLDNVFRELVPAHKQPSAPSTTISHAANSNDSSCPNLPDATTHKLVPTHNQPSVSPSIPAIDGYIHNSSCTALPPTGIPHGHSQPSTPPSSLPSQPSTPVADGYIHDSSCIPQPAASAAHRHNESSALESDGYICNSSHCPPISTNADCGIISTLNQLPTPQLSSESDGYIYDPSCISPTSMHAASGLDEVHRQPSAGSSTSSTSDGYIEDPGDTRLCKLLPSTENEGYILASGSYQPFATLPATASDSYICNSYSTPSSSSASASKSKGEVSRSAEHPHLSFLSDTNTTTGLVDTSQLQPQTGCSQHPNTTNDVMRNVKLQIAIDFPTQALPLSSDYVTESSLPPRVDCSSTRTYSIPGPLQVDGSNYLDRDTLCRGTNTSVDSMYRHESKYTHEEIPKVCMDPAVHPVHEPYTRGTMLNKQAQKSDSSPEALQIGVDGYITTPLHCQ